MPARRVLGRRGMSRSRARADRFDMFGPPYNWCDGACARCVLEPECVLARRLRGSRWVKESGGHDDDAWDAVVADVDTALLRAYACVNDDAEDDRPVSLHAERMRRAGLEYSIAFAALLSPACARGDEVALAASAAAIRVGPKVARLSALLSADGEMRFDPIVAGDGYANLMLIESLDLVCQDAVARLFPPDPEIVGAAALGTRRLLSLLAPLRRRTPAFARRELARLVAAGRAPSPFCVVPVAALTRDAR